MRIIQSFWLYFRKVQRPLFRYMHLAVLLLVLLQILSSNMIRLNEAGLVSDSPTFFLEAGIILVPELCWSLLVFYSRLQSSTGTAYDTFSRIYGGIFPKSK
jgi:hypothetical protein